MTFAADIKRWSTVAEFAAYLQGYDPAIAAWAQGVTLHHTAIPTLAQWRGLASLKGAMGYYIGLEWDAGPHLFLAKGSPNPAHDGIYQLTPLNMPGIHAGKCNSSMWGIEIVGRYDAAPWPAPLAEMVYGVTCALLNWRGLPANVKGHRECLPNKSCPGKAINMNTVRAEVARRLAPAAGLSTEDNPIISPAHATEAQCSTYILARDHKNYSDYDIRSVIVPAYFRICEPVGIDPLGAIAQGLQEGWPTSFWGRRPQRNPAGIGVDGDHSYDPDEGKALGYIFNPDRQRWEDGVSFATWEKDAIPAHIGRLVAYALPASRWSKAQHDLVSYALDYRSLTTKAWGSGPTYKTLGAKHNLANVGLPREKWVAGWAWDGADYGAKIAAIMNQIRGL